MFLTCVPLQIFDKQHTHTNKSSQHFSACIFCMKWIVVASSLSWQNGERRREEEIEMSRISTFSDRSSPPPPVSLLVWLRTFLTFLPLPNLRFCRHLGLNTTARSKEPKAGGLLGKSIQGEGVKKSDCAHYYVGCKVERKKSAAAAHDLRKKNPKRWSLPSSRTVAGESPKQGADACSELFVG